jgi:hypothetical protein
MPIAVIAEIGLQGRIVGAIALRAVGRGVLADRCRNNRDRAVVDVLIVVIGRRVVIARSVIIGVGARGEGAAVAGRSSPP